MNISDVKKFILDEDNMNQTISAIVSVMEKNSRYKSNTDTFIDADFTKNYCLLKFSKSDKEYFNAIFLDNKNKLIGSETLFSGSINTCYVYTREIVKRALALNASAIILAHNHPSGDPEPSSADVNITSKIKESLNLVDIRLLDHIVVGDGCSVSMASMNLM